MNHCRLCWHKLPFLTTIMKIFQFIRNNIPNCITCMNLVCGTLAVIASFHCYETVIGGLLGYQVAYILIGIAALADFLDGFSARLLHAVSGIGKELDSLSDLVSFGIAPCMIVFNMLYTLYPTSRSIYLAVLIAVGGALRLARFNVDTNQSTTFTGLPIPANAIFWIGFTQYMALHHDLSRWIILAVVVVMSWLMVSPLRMFSLKLHNLSLRDNWAQALLIVGTVVLVALMGIVGLACAIVLYVILSIIKREPAQSAS